MFARIFVAIKTGYNGYYKVHACSFACLGWAQPTLTYDGYNYEHFTTSQAV